VTKTKEKPKPKPKPKTKSKKKTEEKIQFLVSSHVLVPKHEIVSDSEIPTILKEFNIEKKSQFPKILADDAAVKEIGAKKGNVIRIYRKEPTGDCLYYRVVV
jgi:DNA-directed RNA polymerase subunit H